MATRMPLTQKGIQSIREDPDGNRTTDDERDNLNPANKIKRRLARKAELARASRRRKKAYVQDLEMKVAQLNARVMELQAQESISSDPRAVALALSAMTELDKQLPSSKVSIGNSRGGKLKKEGNGPIEEINVGTVPKRLKIETINSHETYCIKSNFNGDIRRFSFRPSDFTFQSMKEMISTIYNIDQGIVVSYYDEDGDAVRITSTTELREAYRLSARVYLAPDKAPPAAVVINPSMLSTKKASKVLKIFITLPEIQNEDYVGNYPHANQNFRRRRQPNSTSSSANCNGGRENREKKRPLYPSQNQADMSVRSFNKISSPPRSTFIQMQEVKLGAPCTVSRIWLPLIPTDTLSKLLEQFKQMTNSAAQSKFNGEHVQPSSPCRAVQRLSHCSELLDLKATVQECALDGKSILHVVQVEIVDVVPPNSQNRFCVYINCEENGFWIEARVSSSVKVQLLLHIVLSHIGFLGSGTLDLLYKGDRIPKSQDDTLETYNMNDGDRVDVVYTTGSGFGVRKHHIHSNATVNPQNSTRKDTKVF
mmetsp:Transcript_21124/g.51693  ORF Transcript_21124/g.51693 Transcript_21124/m.51693 type:complete len:538 (-) Transcript_21124:356-1969(-)